MCGYKRRAVIQIHTRCNLHEQSQNAWQSSTKNQNRLEIRHAHAWHVNHAHACMIVYGSLNTEHREYTQLVFHTYTRLKTIRHGLSRCCLQPRPPSFLTAASQNVSFLHYLSQQIIAPCDLESKTILFLLSAVTAMLCPSSRRPAPYTSHLVTPGTKGRQRKSCNLFATRHWWM
jgi:hypothetical protein